MTASTLPLPYAHLTVTEVDDRARESFAKNGFYVVKDGIPTDVRDALHEMVRALFLENAQPGEDMFAVARRLDKEDKGLLYRIQQVVNVSMVLDAFKAACVRCVDPSAYRASGRGVPVNLSASVLFGLPEDKRLAYDWHQEHSYVPGIESIVNCWVPLFNPSSRANGTMSALAGSHRRGQLPYTKHRDLANGYTSLVPEGTEQLAAEHPEHHFECGVGDVVVFHKHLVHRSNYNATPLTRFSGILMLGNLETIPGKLHFSFADY